MKSQSRRSARNNTLSSSEFTATVVIDWEYKANRKLKQSGRATGSTQYFADAFDSTSTISNLNNASVVSAFEKALPLATEKAAQQLATQLSHGF